MTSKKHDNEREAIGREIYNHIYGDAPVFAWGNLADEHREKVDALRLADRIIASRAAAVKPVQGAAVEVCPDCDIAGCTHIRNRTGAFEPPNVTVNMFGSTKLLGELREVAAAIHYPDCWDTATYPTLADAAKEIGCNPADCTHAGVASTGNTEERPLVDPSVVEYAKRFPDGASPSSPLSEEEVYKLFMKAYRGRTDGTLNRGVGERVKRGLAAIAPHLSDTSAEKARVSWLVDALREMAEWDENGRGCEEYGCHAPVKAREALAAFEKGE